MKAVWKSNMRWIFIALFVVVTVVLSARFATTEKLSVRIAGRSAETELPCKLALRFVSADQAAIRWYLWWSPLRTGAATSFVGPAVSGGLSVGIGVWR